MTVPLLQGRRTSPVTVNEGLAIAAILAASGALRALCIDWQGLWNNELITWRAVGQDWGVLIRERVSRNHMPLYFLMLKAWTMIAGSSEAALRVPSAVFGVAGLGLLWIVGRTMLSPATGLAAAGLGALHQQWVAMSFDARMYVHVMAFSLAGVWTAWRWFTTGRQRHAVAHGAVMVAGLATHLLLVTVPVALLLTMLRRGRPWRLCLRHAVPVAVPVLLLIPLMWWWSQVQYKVGRDDWQVPSGGRLIRNSLVTVFGDYEVAGADGKDAVRAAGYVLVALSAAATITWRRRRMWGRERLDEGQRVAHGLLLWVAVLPPLTGYLAGFRTPSALDSARYLAVTTSVTPLLLAAAWVAFSLAWARWAALGLSAALLAVHTGFHLEDEGDGLREAMEWLRGRTFEGRVAVACSSDAAVLAFPYYGVTMPVVPLPRAERDPDVIRAICREAAKAGTERLYLFRYRAGDSPALEVMREETPWLEHLDTERFGLCRINAFEVREAGP